MENITLKSSTGSMTLRGRDMAILSMIDRASGQEFIDASADTPAVVVGYLDKRKFYRNVDSRECKSIAVSAAEKDGAMTVEGVFTGFRGMDIVLTLRASASPGDPNFDFTVELQNRDGSRVIDIQYPFVLCRFDLGGERGTETIALPHGYGTGQIIKNPGESIFGVARKLNADSNKAWEFSADVAYSAHYPGTMYAQFLCYYNDRAGVYLACDDTQANVKRFQPLERGRGLRLGVSHVGDWPQKGARLLEYRTRLRTFQGDWYDAADIYRAWFRQHSTFYAPIRERRDIPKWLLDSPVYITIRPAGLLDLGPYEVLDEFTPYEKCIPLLERIAEQVNAPLAIIMMGWEKRGSWTFPDAFPPVGGEESMRNFVTMARERGWHVGMFGNGTHFVYENVWVDDDSGYDLFDSMNVEAFACREADGKLWDARWGWRPCLCLCITEEGTIGITREYVEHVVDWGFESLQFLDQNNGSVTFACYADDHKHPPAPGKWMHEGMVKFADMLKSITKPGLEPIQSAESGLNECCLKLFHETELRLYPPEYDERFIPLYQYLFHDCVVLHAMMGYAPEPYYLALRSATAFIYGEIPGGVLRGDGLLLDIDTGNWAEWKEPIEDQEIAMRMMRACNDLRRDMPDYLIYGQMERPLQRFKSQRYRWTDPRGRNQDLANVFHTCWSKEGGAQAIALTNWRNIEQTVTLEDRRLVGATLSLSCATPEITRTQIRHEGDSLTLTLPPACCCMLEIL